VPFQRSNSVPFWELPTAKQCVSLEHDTPASLLPAGLGLATIVQVAPFHRTIRVDCTVVVTALPTAKQFVALVHETAARSVHDAPGGFGAGTLVQLVPFHRWINGAGKPEAVENRPTAKQFVALVHDTRVSVACGGPGGFGLATIDHAGAALAGVDTVMRASATTMAIGTRWPCRAGTRARFIPTPCPSFKR
jgi:hypothetical protein